MIKFTHVLCPVDLSGISRVALDHARAIARWYDARLTVLEVVWGGGLPPMPVAGALATADGAGLLSAEDRAGALEALERFRGPVPAGVDEHAELREGPVIHDILATAHEYSTSLIVMGTHGRSGFERLLLGSITEKILRKATCPVITVPPELPEHGYGPKLPYKTILCALDFSPASTRALASALSLAQEADAKLVLTHTIQWPAGQLPAEASDAAETFALTLRDTALARLRDAVPDEARQWCTTTEVVTSGTPHEEIVRLAAEQHADLIVLGTHGRSAMTAPFFGSTAAQVVRHAGCPVLTVRP